MSVTSSRLAMHRILGAYLIAIAFLQWGLYLTSQVTRNSSLFYLDPRIGLFFLETMLRRHEVYPGVLSWSSAAVLGVVGVQVLHNPGRVRRYLIVEPVLAVPTVLMALLVTAANLSPAHGFSVGELVVPMGVLVVVTIVPYGLAWRLRRAVSTRG